MSITPPDTSSPVTGNVVLHPPQLVSDVSSRQPVFVVTQAHQAPEEALRIRASIHHLNCFCAALSRTVAVALKAVCQTLVSIILSLGHRNIGLPVWKRCGRIRCKLCRSRWLLHLFGLKRSQDPCSDRGPGTLVQHPAPGALALSHATLVQPTA